MMETEHENSRDLYNIYFMVDVSPLTQLPPPRNLVARNRQLGSALMIYVSQFHLIDRNIGQDFQSQATSISPCLRSPIQLVVC